MSFRRVFKISRIDNVYFVWKLYALCFSRKLNKRMTHLSPRLTGNKLKLEKSFKVSQKSLSRMMNDTMLLKTSIESSRC